MARDLIRLSGLEEGVDVEIKYTGVRPGEKLFEELLIGDEDVQATEHPKVIRAVNGIPNESMDSKISELIRVASIAPNDTARLRAAIVDLVPDFISPELHSRDIVPIDARRGPGEASLSG